MNRTKSILLSATALAMFAAPQVADAQTAPGATVVFLPQATPPTRTPGSVDCVAVGGRGTDVGAISADGTVVAGNSGNINGCAIRWTNGVPTVSRNGTSAPGIFEVYSLSGDGQVIVGRDSNAINYTVYWTQSRQSQYFPDPSLNEVIYEAGYVNSAGTIFALNSTFPTQSGLVGGIGKAYRWSASGGYQDLGSFGPTWDMRVSGISGAGDVITGNAADTATFVSGAVVQRAFVWRAAGGLAQLPDLLTSPGTVNRGSFSATNGISRDGSTIVGVSAGPNNVNQAVYWRSGSITGLGFIPGTTPSQAPTSALAANADGSIIVGGLDVAIEASRAWRWTATTGIQDLNLIATTAGLNLNGFVLTNAVGLSDNGQYIAGNSYNAAQNQYLGFVLQLAQVTQSRLIVTIRLPGVTLTSIVNQTFNTQVDGLLNGRSVFTRTVTDPITGAGGVIALADARAALQVGSGLRRVVIGAPVLISNTTTVLGTTNAVVDVASGTTTSTATVNTFGPATVATGNLGTCATPAANNTNPTGCSLPGTPVTVDAGILNSNVFTNTLNSVTPTTTPTVNQLISARWQVSATAGNQFGTVHALVGPAAFDRGDRLVGQLVGMGAGGSGGSSLARSDVGQRGWTMFGGYFGNWSSTDADARVPVARVSGNSNGFVLGVDKQLDAVRLGAAVDYGTSDYRVQDAQYPETLSFRHTQIALFGGWNSGGFSLDGAASYGFGTARTSLTTPTTPANGERDVRSWSLGAQAGYAVPLGKRASAALVGGVRHTSAQLDRFAETGGPAPLAGLAQTVSRTRLFAGVEAQAGLTLGDVTLTPRIHARYAHDRGTPSGTADLVFASAPNGPVMQALGPGVGRNVVELGGGLDAQLSAKVHLWASYDGSFRSGNRTHAARAGLTVNW